MFFADGLTYFEDLMNETSLTSSLSILEKDYDEAIRSKGELDERVFINEEDSLLGSGSLSGGVMNITGVKVQTLFPCANEFFKFIYQFFLPFFSFHVCGG